MNPPASSEAELETDAELFLKPVILEASPDRVVWREFARSSIFAVQGTRLTRLQFAPNDRRYWRIRLDDRNGDAIALQAIRVSGGAESAATARDLRIPQGPSRSLHGVSTTMLALPSENLPVSSIRLDIEDLAFSRHATVFEKILFRGELRRRVLGSAQLYRSPGTGDNIEIGTSNPAGRAVEIEVEDGDSPPLRVRSVSARLISPRIVFSSPGAASLFLRYGSLTEAPPNYDLAAALRHGAPPGSAHARLGAPRQLVATTPGLSAPNRSPLIGVEEWNGRAAISLPSDGSGSLAYLTLEDEQISDASLRIVDSRSRQVPYVRESDAATRRLAVGFAVSGAGSRTFAVVGPFEARRRIFAIELEGRGPDYFRREVTVTEDLRDNRGSIGRVRLGSAFWERLPGTEMSRLRIAISRPSQKELRVEVENGDNPALTISRVLLFEELRRIDFLFLAGDSLTLLYGNRAARPPEYDLRLLSEKLQRLPAREAFLGPPTESSSGSPLPRWFWSALIVAGIVVALAMARSLRA